MRTQSLRLDRMEFSDKNDELSPIESYRLAAQRAKPHGMISLCKTPQGGGSQSRLWLTKFQFFRGVQELQLARKLLVFNLRLPPRCGDSQLGDKLRLPAVQRSIE